MFFTKKFLAVAASVAMAVTGVVATGGAASAAGTNIYKIELNKSSAASNATDFTTCKGKVYFAADMAAKGRGIFASNETTPGTATLAVSNGDGVIKPNPRGLNCVGNYVLYNDSAAGGNSFAMYAYNTVTGVNTELKTPGDVSFKMGWEQSPLVATVSGVSYFIANPDGDSQYLWTFDGATGAIASVGSGISANSGSLRELGGTLYVEMNGVIDSYDMVNDLWTPVSISGSDLKILGKYRYNNADVLIVSGGVGNWSYGVFAIDVTGTATRLGNWTASYDVRVVNLGETLYAYQWNSFAEVSAADGQKTEKLPTMFPGATRVGVENAVQTDGAIVMMATNDDTQSNPTGKEMLYRFDGTQQAIGLQQTAPIASNTSLPEYPNFQRGWGRNTTMYATNNGVIVNLYLDSSIGYEPYFSTSSGQVTSLGNLNTSTDGSSPDPECMGTTGTVDYIGAGSIDADGNVHRTLTKFKQNGIYLDGTIMDLGSADGPCAFAQNGTDLYFQAYDRTAGNDTLYKMDSTGNITSITALDNSGEVAFFASNKYFWMADDAIYVYDFTTSTQTRLIASGNDGFSSVNEMVGVGSKIYFQGEDNNTGYEDIYSLDTANVATAPVKITNVSDNNWILRPENLKVSGTTVYYSASLDANTGAKLFSIDSTKNLAPQVVADLLTDGNGWVEYTDSVLISGTDAWVTVGDDNSSERALVKVNLTTKTAAKQTIPVGFDLSCVAPAGKKLLLESRDGQMKYFADGALTDSGVHGTSNNEELCYYGAGALGTYFGMPVQVLNNSNSGYELHYVGPLIPRIVSRLGNNTAEAPSTGIGTGVDTGWVLPGGTPVVTPVDTDNPDLGVLNETKIFKGSKGSITFPDGSGFDVDSKGRIYSKFKSKYLVMVSGSIKVTYKVGKATKAYTCVLKPYGSKVKLKKALTVSKLYKSKQGCQIPAAAIASMKIGKITIVQKATTTRYYPTTAIAKTPTGKAIKKLVRTMTVQMGK